MAVPAFDADGKLWSVQYVNSDGSKRFARESQKRYFHVVGSADPVGDLANAAAIVVAEGYATAATLKSLHAETGDPLGRVAFVATFDAGNVPASPRCFASGTSARRWSLRRTMIGRWKAKRLVESRSH